MLREKPPSDTRHHIQIRRAHTSDASELLKLIRAYYRFDRIRFRPNTVEAALRKLLRSRSLGRIWIIHDGPKAVGYVMLTFNYDLEFGGLEAIVTDLFVRSEYRNLGLGRDALAVVYAECRAMRIRTVELQVEEHNKNAQKCYLKLGFKKLSGIVMSRNV